MDITNLLKSSDSKIVLLVIDGLGGVPHPDYKDKTELEYAYTPNMDELTSRSMLGLTVPVSVGITPGSGPAHLALFGYDPVKHQIGRGVLEALGVGVELKKGDIAARGNFATKGKEGTIVDRRAGRIDTAEARRLIEKLNKEIDKIESVEIIFSTGKEHRFVLVLRGEGLSSAVSDTDPQKEGYKILEPEPLNKNAEKTIFIVKKLLRDIDLILKDEPKANTVLLRGFSEIPEITPFGEKYRLRSLALAVYPMYKGITKLLGFDVLFDLKTFEEELKALQENWSKYDFFYLHFKDTDKAGEDGDFLKKVEAIECIDKKIPDILSLQPDVFVITGDHSTPVLFKSHSWHPNPLLLFSKGQGVYTNSKGFTEKSCREGYLGVFPLVELMTFILANAGRLKKFGA